MSINYALGAEQLTRTTQYIEEVNDDGIMSARATYRIRKGNAFSLPVVSPENPYLYYKKHSISVEGGSTGKFYTVQVYFEGIGSGGSLPENYGEFLVGDARIPIQAHPKFKSDLAGTPLSPSGYAPIWNPDDNTFVKFHEFLTDLITENPLRGVESFEAGQITWRWHMFSTSGSYSDVDYMDKIYTDVTGGPPTPSGRSWKFSGMTVIPRGYIYEQVNDFKLSGPLGWITTPPVYV